MTSSSCPRLPSTSSPTSHERNGERIDCSECSRSRMGVIQQIHAGLTVTDLLQRGSIIAD